MSVLVEEIKKDIYTRIMDAAGRAVAAGQFPAEPLPAFRIEVPQDVSFGDFAANAVLIWSKTLKMAPRSAADIIISHFETDGKIQKIETAGPGFLNITLGNGFFSSIVDDVLQKGADYGKSSYGGGKRVLVEFVSANPTGPMHIGNARGGALGDCLASVLSFAGYSVDREFYVNDAGNQIEKFKNSLEARYLQLFDSSVKMPEDCYMGEDITEHARAFKEKFGDKYLNTDSETRKTALCDFALPKNIEGLKRDLLKYRIEYDNWYFESGLHNSGRVQQIIEQLKESGHTYEKDGALWFNSEKFGDEKDRVLVRAGGIPTYLAPDIAYHYDKLTTRGYDLAVDVLGADHHGYVPRLRAALTALGVDEKRLKVVIMQMVRLVKNGETYKLSKRSGKAITLSTLLDEVPLDAARFIFNSKEPNTHLEFDLDLAVEQSSSNPVYYVQYAHARICSILRNLEGEGIKPERPKTGELDLLTAPEERELVRHIAAFTEEIETAAKTLDPSRITRYAYDTSAKFHKFYNACRVKCGDDRLMRARLSLCIAARTVLKNCFDILKIDAPEEM